MYPHNLPLDMRVAAAFALALSILAAGCVERSPAQLVLWRDVRELRRQADADPSSPALRQRYIDALANYVRAYPDDAEASTLYGREELAYARELVRQGRQAAAIPYYENILEREPDRADVVQELEAARAQAGVPRTSFESLRKGMTRDEVTALLGAPRPGWSHTLQKGSSTYETWYYRKPDGGTASVGFVDGKTYVAEYDGVLRLEQ
jgi:tetratricopeptide (TPR) repeat protein